MVIKVERGRPTPEELAAVVALVQARAAAAQAEPEGPSVLDTWAAPARNVPGSVPTPGPGAWRTSAWPR
ncbi:acyl-CoA carboxylase epsilon subunit [Actinacidiphila sp. DG2A-62]|uniref:acyl-CoA carboxylase epsilon subunit n=1 Tax=Actinacidiphila sp. DG2A-62 TaxID=3108821 RepID=UPI002DB62474|nr:acyl-CoA carboxylase epsilon subunit [Actinacidiphila sp. DG2A-62]MEC3996652.1 acyl-CoA carboxylase epsilon subunit [Actinacidiphila sp. DG2A-62]